MIKATQAPGQVTYPVTVTPEAASKLGINLLRATVIQLNSYDLTAPEAFAKIKEVADSQWGGERRRIQEREGAKSVPMSERTEKWQRGQAKEWQRIHDMSNKLSGDSKKTDI